MAVSLSRRELTAAAGIPALAPLMGTRVAWADNADNEPEPFSVSSDATSSVTAVPDIANISFGVSVAGAESTEVHDEIASTVDAVVAALAQAEIDKDAVRVASINIWPTYDNGTSLLGGSRTPRITGYKASVDISVERISVDQIGDVVAIASSAGVNRMNGITYQCSDYDARYDEALAAACERARHKAEIAAAALGYTVVGVDFINVGYENMAYRTEAAVDYEYAFAEEDAAVDMQKTIAFDPGTIEITANVNVNFLAI